jgi:hypothetical protein
MSNAPPAGLAERIVQALDRPLFAGDDGRAWTPFSLRFRGKTLLRVTSALVLVAQIVLTILLAVNNAYNMGMFTLWSLTVLTVFVAVLLASLFVQYWLLTDTLLFGLPVVVGLVTFVVIAIIVIIANNSSDYTKNTPCAQPPPADPKYTVSQVHTGDWLEHFWPVAALTLILLAGAEFLANYVVVRSLRSFTPIGQWLYFIYWMNGALVLLVIYDSIFDIDKIYPTSFTAVQRFFILLAIIWIVMLYAWWIFTARYALDEMHVTWLPTIAEWARGRTAGAGLPSPLHHEMLLPTLEEWAAAILQAYGGSAPPRLPVAAVGTSAHWSL